jgi:NAD(P)-dependent dehydrogenase (short-subunit alcohol dehydrogenase family)
MRWEGKAALITGGSRGLGAALGRELARVGARVVVSARDEEALARVVEGMRTGGCEAHALVADLAEPEAAERLAGAAAALVGPVDVLVHNAATLGPVPLRALLDTDPAELARVLEVNVLAPFRLTRALAGSMVLRGGGLVVMVSSDAARVGYPGWGAYGLSKAALEQMARVLAAELEPAGVRVNIVDPGEMDTRMHAEAVPEADRATLADPSRVAARLVDWMAQAEAWPTGALVEIAQPLVGARS